MIPAQRVTGRSCLRLGLKDREIAAILVHGWWNSLVPRLARVKGNVVDPTKFADIIRRGSLRYYLMTAIATGYHADFTERFY